MLTRQSRRVQSGRANRHLEIIPRGRGISEYCEISEMLIQVSVLAVCATWKRTESGWVAIVTKTPSERPAAVRLIHRFLRSSYFCPRVPPLRFFRCRLSPRLPLSFSLPRSLNPSPRYPVIFSYAFNPFFFVLGARPSHALALARVRARAEVNLTWV